MNSTSPRPRGIGERIIEARRRSVDFFISIHKHADQSEAPIFGWTEFRREWRWWYIPLSLFDVLISLSLGVFLIFKAPLGDLSVYTGFMRIGGLILPATTPIGQERAESLFAWIFLVSILIFPQYFPTIIGRFSDFRKGIPQYAMNEEVLFRSGSETWSLIDKIRSCVSFGLAHLTMLLVPLGALPSLMLGGGMLMVAYLTAHKTSGSKDKALRVSACLHATYNIVVIPCVVIGLVIYFTTR